MSPSQGENLHIIKTDTFTLHHFQSVSGLVFVLNTKAEVPGKYILIPLSLNSAYNSVVSWIDLYNNLQYIYSSIFIDYIQRNPLYKYTGNEVINCPLFAAKVEEYLLSIPILKQ